MWFWIFSQIFFSKGIYENLGLVIIRIIFFINIFLLFPYFNTHTYFHNVILLAMVCFFHIFHKNSNFLSVKFY